MAPSQPDYIGDVLGADCVGRLHGIAFAGGRPRNCSVPALDSEGRVDFGYEVGSRRLLEHLQQVWSAGGRPGLLGVHVLSKYDSELLAHPRQFSHCTQHHCNHSFHEEETHTLFFNTIVLSQRLILLYVAHLDNRHLHRKPKIDRVQDRSVPVLQLQHLGDLVPAGAPLALGGSQVAVFD